MKISTLALSWAITALTVVPGMSEELLLGDSVIQSDKYDEVCNGGDCYGGDIAVDEFADAGKGCATPCYCEPLWTFRAGLLVLKQESPSELKFFDFDFEGGIELSAMRRLGECRALEVRFMGVDDWSDQLNLGDIQAGYSSDLYSTEFNLRRQWTDRITTLAGFRWVELHEELMVAEAGNPVVASDVDNHMYGLQVGGEALLWDRGGPLQVTSGTKVGIYYNRADGGFTEGGQNYMLKDDHTSFLGEWDITTRYAITQCLAVRASYDLLWIAGTAAAGGDHGPALDTSNNHFYHGGVVGAELTY